MYNKILVMRSLSYANNKVADQPAHLRSLGQRHMLAVDLIVLHVCLLYSKTLAGLVGLRQRPARVLEYERRIISAFAI